MSEGEQRKKEGLDIISTYNHKIGGGVDLAD